MGTTAGWADLTYHIQTRPEFACGGQLVTSHPNRWIEFLIAGRLMLIPFSVVGALVCFQWAERLYGTTSALVALVLWCFSPNILTWNAIICSDGLATSFGVAASFSFCGWLRRPQLRSALVAGTLLGIAQVTKMTWIILFPLWAALWAGCHFCYKSETPRRRQIAQLAAILFAGGYILNMGYAFDGTFRLLKTYEFFSRPLASPNVVTLPEVGGNRFSHSLLGCIPAPLPEYYLRGIDLQKADFETGKPSYLCGKWSTHGWWYYYLIGLLKDAVGNPRACVIRFNHVDRLDCD